jgi:hypothetical protein
MLPVAQNLQPLSFTETLSCVIKLVLQWTEILLSIIVASSLHLHQVIQLLRPNAAFRVHSIEAASQEHSTY